MKIGLFGGSFDPIHLGHLILAERCRDLSHLDQIWFVPTAMSPLKPRGSLATSKQRTEMLQLATAGHEQFRVSTIEVDRKGISYTIDTLRSIREEFPTDELFLILGTDAWNKFSEWREPQKILKLAIPLIVSRPGSDVSFDRLAELCDAQCLMEIKAAQIDGLPLIEISSSKIREAVSRGSSIRYLVPRPVEMYIFTHRIYGSAPK